MDSSEFLLPVLSDNMYLSYDPSMESSLSTPPQSSMMTPVLLKESLGAVSGSVGFDSSPILNFPPSSPPMAHLIYQGSSSSTTTASSPVLTATHPTSTPILTPTTEKITTIQTTLPNAIQSSPPFYLYQQSSPQTHDHFMKLLTQIQQHQQQSTSFQTNHEIINAHTAAAVATGTSTTPPNSTVANSNNSPNLLVPLLDQSTDPMLIDSVNEGTSVVPSNTNTRSNSQATATATATAPTPTTNIKSKTRGVAIVSPPNSPRKSRVANKIKAKTQQVQQNIQQAQQAQQAQQQNLSPVSSATTPTLSPTMATTSLTGFTLASNSPPHSPPTAPPSLASNATSTTTTTSTVGAKRKTTLRQTVGPSVGSIITQLGYSTNGTTGSNSPALSPSNSFVNNPPLNNSLNCTDINLSTSQTSLTASTASTNNNEDKKAICLGFLKYYFNVNTTMPTPHLRRSLILSLYVNKIPQDLRYRRPNDMANLCVVLYGFLFHSLDEHTIKEFINMHSSSSTKSKKEEKKRKRKRDSGKKTASSPTDDDTAQPLTKTLKTSASSLNSWTTLDLTNLNDKEAKEANSQMDVETIQSEEEEEQISLHDAFVNCLKSCNLLPFLEFKNVQSLPPPNELPITDNYYTYDDLIKWENELKDLKLSVKQQTQQQLKMQKHQLLLQQSSSPAGGSSIIQSSAAASPSLSNSAGTVPLTPSFLSLQHHVITPSNSSSNLLEPQSPITQSINNALSVPILNLNNQSNIGNQPNINNINNTVSQDISSNLPSPSQPSIDSSTSSTSIFNNSNSNSLTNSQQSLTCLNGSNNNINNNNNANLPPPTISTSQILNNSTWLIDNAKNGVLVNVYENDESFVIYVAIPHSQTNSLKVTIGHLEVTVEGIISIPDTIYLPNGTEIQVPVTFPLSTNGLQRKEFDEGSFTKKIKLSSPVSSSVVGKREGVIVIIAQKERIESPSGQTRSV